MDMMRKISITLRDETLALLDSKVAEYKRSQLLDYAARAVLARLAGKASLAIEYEQAAKALIKS